MKEKTKTFTMRFLAVALSLVTMLTMVPALGANAAEIDEEPVLVEEQSVETATVEPRAIGNNAGLGIAYYKLTVYKEENKNTTWGSIGQHESFTILENKGNCMRVQYSTSGDPKEGYIFDVGSVYVVPNTCLARITTGANVYYGQGEYIYETAGSVSAGEYVVVLARQYDWDYIEYNTAGGRKRGYIMNSNLTRLNTPAVEQDLPCNIYYPELKKVIDKRYDVYAGPTEKYRTVGYVDRNDGELHYCCEFTKMGSKYVYVEYKISNGKMKSGFIKIG